MNSNLEKQKYVTSTEGEKLLGVDTGRFFYYVQSHQISREPGSRKRNARYSVVDILEVRKKLSARQEKKKPSPNGIADWIVSEDDVWASMVLDRDEYGVAIPLAELDYYAARVKRNPRIALAVFDSEHKKVLAYISLLPLPESILLDVMRGKIHETKIPIESIEQYDRQGAYTLLAESVVVPKKHPELLYVLLKHLISFWCEQYPDRHISKIYAQSGSDSGDVLIQKLFLSPREDLAPDAHVLNLARPGASRFIKHFQQCIEEKQRSLEMQEAS